MSAPLTPEQRETVRDGWVYFWSAVVVCSTPSSIFGFLLAHMVFDLGRDVLLAFGKWLVTTP